MKQQRQAWALKRQFDFGPAFLGIFCWSGVERGTPATKLFGTRAAARGARASCCYKDAKVVKVLITIEEIVTK